MGEKFGVVNRDVAETDMLTFALGIAFGVVLGLFSVKIAGVSIGLAGMYDPASTWNLPVQKEDFGQTLGHYGVGAGPFLVLPIFGPSTLRDTTGLVFDTAVHTAVMNWTLDDVNNKNEIKLGINLLGAIDERHRTPFRYYQSGSPFEYEYLRKLYLEKRIMDIAK